MAADQSDFPTAPVEDTLCVVCWDRPRGVPLRPCGHNHFCARCTQHFRTCPLCRVPLSRLLEEEEEAPDHPQRGVVRRPTFISQTEAWGVFGLGAFVFAFLVIAGYIEWKNDIPEGCSLVERPPNSDNSSGDVYFEDVCKYCILKNEWHGDRCSECEPGYINGGLKCYRHVDELPRVKTGAALGGRFYFILIICTQVFGMLTEVILIRRMRLRNLMPRKELIVLVSAMAIEMTRMLLVDVFILQEYFGGRSYGIYRAPMVCDLTAPGAWQGADQQWYCEDPSPYSVSTSFYIASALEAFSMDTSLCSVFTNSSALLDYDERTGSWPIHTGGHPRFSRLGWVVGGEFALYYFFASFINEVADNMFIVPTVANFGKICKAFSVALELFQLGALCPAAIFTHGDCLHYTDPMGVSLGPVRDIITLFGYCIWGFGLMMFPLGAIGLVLVVILVVINSCLLKCLVWPVFWCFGEESALDLDEARLRFEDNLRDAWSFFMRSKVNVLGAIMLLAFVPLLFSGMVLGALVVVGQASKKGAMQVLTAIVLLSDVLFKIGATAVTEAVDYMLHVRVRNAVTNAARPRPVGQAIGNPQPVVVEADVTHPHQDQHSGSSSVSTLDAATVQPLGYASDNHQSADANPSRLEMNEDVNLCVGPVPTPTADAYSLGNHMPQETHGTPHAAHLSQLAQR